MNYRGHIGACKKLQRYRDTEIREKIGSNSYRSAIGNTAADNAASIPAIQPTLIKAKRGARLRGDRWKRLPQLY
jgi:hypothetical protein